MKFNNILAIGAHPDDVEFGCGGSLIKFAKNGNNVTIVSMTCSDCQNLEGEYVRKAKRSRREAEKSASLIGADLIILPFEDQVIPFSRETIFELERIIIKLNIDTIFCHWSGDSHQDHINTLRSTLAAARHVNNILLYEQVPLPRVGVISSPVNFYIDISSYYHLKEKAFKTHKSQVNEKYKKDIIRGTKALAEYRGSQCNCRYAEAFNAIKLKY